MYKTAKFIYDKLMNNDDGILHGAFSKVPVSASRRFSPSYWFSLWWSSQTKTCSVCIGQNINIPEEKCDKSHVGAYKSDKNSNIVFLGDILSMEHLK